MEMPEEVGRMIQDFARPVCRLDWRHGSYIFRNIQAPESNFRSDLLMRVHDMRGVEDYVRSFNELYDTYDLWKDTYHAYFYPEIVTLMEGE